MHRPRPLRCLLEHLDRRIHAPKELENETGVPVLGAIPRLAPNETPAAASADARSPFAESYRSVRTALQFATEHGIPRSLLITSAGVSAGIDMALHLVSRLAGIERTREVRREIQYSPLPAI